MKKEDTFRKLDVLRRIYGEGVVTSMYKKARLTMKPADSVRKVEAQLYASYRKVGSNLVNLIWKENTASM